MPGLTRLVQDDFSAGIFRWPRHLIPAKGVYDAVDAILTDDGSLTQRGGTALLGNYGDGTRVDRVWDGYMSAPGERRLLLTTDSYLLARLNDSFAATQTWLASTFATHTHRMVECAGFVFIDSRNVYGGGGKALPAYATGTVTVNIDSPTVTGSGTSWLANAEKGSILGITGEAALGIVKSVDSDTQVTLMQPWPASAHVGVGYTLGPIAPVTQWPQLDLTGVPVAIEFVAAVGTPPRLIVARAHRVTFSAPGQPFKLDSTDFHEIPGGESIVGLGAPARDMLFVFTTGGVWVIRNLDLDLTGPDGSPQQQLQRASDRLLWGANGIVAWRTGVIATCLDDVWYFDGISEPQNLSKPITQLYRSYVTAGEHPGTATIYQGHLLVPILTPGNTIVDTLVCRLDTLAWTRWTTTADALAAMAPRSASNSPRLLAGGPAVSLSDYTGCLSPAAANKTDPTPATTPKLNVTLRDQELGSNNPHNQVKQVRVTYELADAATDNPVLNGYVASDAPGASFTQLTVPTTDAPESDGGTPFTWTANKSGRRARIRLQKGTAPAAGLTIRRVEMFVRQAGKQV